MAYMSNVAAKRGNPATDRISPAPALASDSNQIRTLGQSAKFKNPSSGPAASNQVRTMGNNKGTGVAGRPSSIGNAQRDFTLPTSNR